MKTQQGGWKSLKNIPGITPELLEAMGFRVERGYTTKSENRPSTQHHCHTTSSGKARFWGRWSETIQQGLSKKNPDGVAVEISKQMMVHKPELRFQTWKLTTMSANQRRTKFFTPRKMNLVNRSEVGRREKHKIEKGEEIKAANAMTRETQSATEIRQ